MNSLIVLFLQGHANGSIVLPLIWTNSPTIFVTGCLVLYNSDPTSISKILDITQEMKILPQVLEAKPFAFSIDLAALASRREYLNLEKWLMDHIKEEGPMFVSCCLDFLREKIAVKLLRQDKQAPQTVPLTLEVCATFLKVLISLKE